MGHAAPLPFLPASGGSRPAPEARFDLDSLIASAPRGRRAQRAVAPSVVSFAAHVIAVAAIIVLPLVLGEVSLPVASEAVHAFFVPPPDVALPPPPPPPPAVARALTPAPTAPRPVTEATFLAPIEVPEGVQPEEGIDLGVEGGVPGGVEGGVPGGVVGGVVGGLPEAPPPAPTVAPVRVGGLVRVPKLLNRVTPAYPQIAVAARTSAILILEATVGADGRVQEVKVLRGQPLFDQAAVDAVKQWRYRPLLLNGVAVPFIVTVTLSFSLMNQGA
jgi:periplasmic protein TonB